MQIFVSYASEHRNTADRIALGLRQEGHSVFFDRDALPSGDAFDTSIRKAIGGSDLLIFLISQRSVSSDSYALTEMGFARERWNDPSGHVLPVLVESIAMDDIPPYLRSVTIMKPRGDLVAEILGRVAAISHRHRRRFWTWIGGSAGAVAVAGAMIAAYGLRGGIADRLELETCHLRAAIHAGGNLSRAIPSDLLLHVTGGQGATNSFIVDDDGLASLHVEPEQLPSWSLEVRDADGLLLATVQLDGCPDGPKKLELNGDLRLAIDRE